MEERQFQELSKKVDMLVKLSAANFISGKENKEAIAFLSKAGFKPFEIAELIGTSANTVRVALHRHKKKRNSTRRKK